MVNKKWKSDYLNMDLNLYKSIKSLGTPVDIVAMVVKQHCICNSLTFFDLKLWCDQYLIKPEEENESISNRC